MIDFPQLRYPGKYQRADVFTKGGVLFTTNLIVDGINILDNNIGNIFLLDPQASTDLIQFPARFKNGYQNYFILVSGQSQGVNDLIKDKTRQDLVSLYYNLALRQKEVCDNLSNKMKRHFKKEGLEHLMYAGDYNSRETWYVKLVNRFPFLDSRANILEERILQRVQRIETLKMRYDIDALKVFMENDDLGYNFQLNEVPLNDLIQNKLTSHDINKAGKTISSLKMSNEKLILDILSGRRGGQERDQLLQAYLEKNNRLFPLLTAGYNVREGYISGIYEEFISVPEVKKMLWRYCIGLELDAVDPLDMVKNDFSDKVVNSIRRICLNLKRESKSSHINKDAYYYRFFGLRNLATNVRRDSL